MKNLNQSIIIFLSVFATSTLFAQDFLSINNFNFNEANFNTAYLASDSSKLDVSTIVFLGRTVENNTKFHFLVEGNISKLGLGIGVKVNTSFFQMYQATTAEILIAKKVNFGKKHSMRFGLNSGIVLSSIRDNRINEYTEINDPVFNNGEFDKVGFTAGLGLNYVWNDRLDIGVSLPMLVNSLSGLEPVYFGSVAYDFKPNKDFSIKPRIMVYGPKYTDQTFYGDVKFSYKKYIWLKAGANTNTTTTFGIGGKVKFLSLAYIYNHNFLAEYKEAYQSAHNINITFHFLQKKNN